MKLPYQIRNIDEVYGVYAIEDLPLGSKVMKLYGKYVKEPSKYTIQIGERHLDSAYGSRVNHSCSANTMLMIAINTLDGEEGLVPWYSRINGTLTSMVIGNPYPVLVATTAISIEDEITFNYNHSESILANPFKCSCCGKWIRGRDYKEKQQKSMSVYEHRGYE